MNFLKYILVINLHYLTFKQLNGDIGPVSLQLFKCVQYLFCELLSLLAVKRRACLMLEPIFLYLFFINDVFMCKDALSSLETQFVDDFGNTRQYC